MIINPYQNGSLGAKELKQALVAHGLKVWITRKAPKRRATIVNWGGKPAYDQRGYVNVLNRDTSALVNKLTFFQTVGDQSVPWTTDPEVAQQWKKVVCRSILNGHSGQGITIWRQGDGDIPKVPLYTKYQPKTAEYRVHVGRALLGGVKTIFMQQKVFPKHRGGEPKSWDVRSHDNGFVFQLSEDPPINVVNAAEKFHQEFFPVIDFCAWDVLYCEKTNRAYVIEGNTAPGLEPRTAAAYAAYFVERGLR